MNAHACAGRWGLVLMAVAWAVGAGAQELVRDYPVRPVPFTDVKVTDPFWGSRLETNRRVSVPHALKMCDETGRTDNFAVAGKLKAGKFRGLYFDDSDVYKVMEGAAHVLAVNRDPKLEAALDELIAKVAAAQEPDGYLYTARTLCGPDYMPPGGKERWSDMAGGHELYCAGHLYEAAAAHFQATGKRTLLDVALKNADLVCREFGPRPGQRTTPCGHQEIELGLVKLYRVTGQRKYLDQAKFFVDARGTPLGGRRLMGEFCQDTKPILQQTEAFGHAVRAGYMYAALADMAGLTGEAAYRRTSETIWGDVAGRKLYLTGGVGARGSGEAFGDPYELPNRSAYTETCAAIASALWNQRMFQLTGEARYVDVFERTIYNGFLVGVAMEGDRFNYVNPLENDGSHRRQPWFGCACCPSNVVRFLPTIPGAIYATRGDDELFVNLFVASSAAAKLPAAGSVRVTQETRYPWDGAVKVTVAPERPATFTLLVRIPGWAQRRPVPTDLYRYLDADAAAAGVNVKIVGVPAPAGGAAAGGAAGAVVMGDGYARITRQWRAGDAVEVTFPMPVRRVVAHEKVKDDEGRVALERGPIVFCAEGVDQPGGRVLPLVLPDDTALTSEFKADLLGGVQVIRGEARVAKREPSGAVALTGEKVALTAIPYYAWQHRAASEMAVWLAREARAAKPLPAATLAHRSKVTASHGGPVAALTDQLEPRSSIDHNIPYFHWWPRKGTAEWVQFELPAPTRVKGIEVYWFDDTGIGECRVPRSWTLKAKVKGQWQDVEKPSGFGVAKDAYNRTTFEPLEAEALRLEIQSEANFAGGIHEVRLIESDAPDGPAAPAAAAAAAPAAAANALRNPSFEEVGRNDQPRGWRTTTWAGRGTFALDEGVARTGRRSLSIASTDGGDLSWTITVPVEPFARYRLAGWIRTEGLAAGSGRGALLNVHNLQGVATPAVTGTSDWKLVETTFETLDQDAVQVNCLFGGWGRSTGKAWFDDVSLTLVERKGVPEPSIAIDAAKASEPINPFIYGQFIEHLGRCIYGGIWAEMLEDRKFFYAVGHRESPWRAVGDAGAVTMSREKPFVGQHTPVIALDAAQGRGITQGALGVLAGKEYVGRIWLAGEGDVGPVTVSLAWGDAPGQRQAVSIEGVKGEWTKFPLKFTAGAASDDARLEVVARGTGRLKVGTASLMPADHVQGFRADTLALLRELDSPIYRWPGGNFVSGYDWRDGIGDPDRRPPRKNPAWRGVEHNDVGMHEFIALCRLLKTEPYIAVNAGLGQADSARDQVLYANAPADTPMGRQRAANGHPEPFKVRYWGIGNEMYGDWQLGHMPLARYVEKHVAFAKVMREADPSVKLIAVGAVGPWSEGMLKGAAAQMDLMSEHFYCQERPGLYGHVKQVPDAVRNVAEAHRRYRTQIDALRGRDVRVALDEWNYWYGPHVFGELGTRYFLKDALGIAAGIHEMARCTDVFYMANYAQTVNVIGAIKTSRTTAAFETTGLVLKLYRRQFGTVPVATTATGLLDAQAAWTADRSALTVAVVNPTMRRRTLKLDVKGAALAGGGKRYQIAGDDPQAFNDPSAPPKVVIEESAVTGVKDALDVAPCSVTLFALEARPL